MLAVLISSCRLDAAVNITIERDGSGTVVATIITDQEFESNAALAGEPFLSRLVDRVAAVPGAALSVVADAGTTTYRVTASAADPDRIEAILRGLDLGLEGLRIDVAGSRITVSGATRPLAALDDLSGYLEGFDAADFDDQVGALVRLTLPGTVTYDNAGRDGDGTLEWAIRFSDPAITIGASSLAGGGIPWELIFLLAAVVGSGWFLVVVRRTTSSGSGARRADAPELVPIAKDAD